jgi:hypothetical protein
MIQSELRKGYRFVESWIDQGMPDAPSACFTEGDLRLAAELCLYAVEQDRQRGSGKR